MSPGVRTSRRRWHCRRDGDAEADAEDLQELARSLRSEESVDGWQTRCQQARQSESLKSWGVRSSYVCGQKANWK